MNISKEHNGVKSYTSATTCGEGNSLLVIITAHNYKIEVWSLDKLVRLNALLLKYFATADIQL